MKKVSASNGSVKFAGGWSIVASIVIGIGERTNMPKLDIDYTETISLRLTKEQRDKLKAAADARGVSQSDFLRVIIDDIDLLPHLSEKFKRNIRKAGGQRQVAWKLIEDALQKQFRRIW